MAIKDPQEVWTTTLAQIEVKLDSPAMFKMYFKGTRLVEITRGKAIISVPNPYILEWLESRHEELVRDTISHVFGNDLILEFVISQDGDAGNAAVVEEPSPLFSGDSVLKTVKDAITKAGLSEKYSLNNFVVGDANRIAHAAAMAIINNPGQVYNPLFLHGRTGVGKTHLAQSIGRSVLERNPSKQVYYSSSEGFLNDLVRAIRTQKTAEFRKKYRQVNILIIDDIQLISQWVSTQAEFFNTFNELYQNSSQVILISDRPPEEIKDLEDRLRSRFQGGMVVDIERPEFELRLAILDRRAKDLNLNLNQRILETIARGISDNIRELEGALQKVALFNQMKQSGELTLEEVASLIGADAKSKREKVKVPAVIKSVSKDFGVTVKDLKGPRRTKELALARQVAMYVLREEFGYKLEDVARFLGRSDHTTVINAVDKVKSKMLTTDGFKMQVINIVKTLQESTVDEIL